MPEVRTCGSFGDDAPTVKWVQPTDLWQALLMHHSGTFSLNGHILGFEPFDLFVVPPMSHCEVERTGGTEFVYNYAGFKPQSDERDTVSLPVKTSLGDEGHYWDKVFRTALNQLQFSRTFAHVVVWNLLWSVAQPQHAVIRSVYTDQAEKLIDERIGQRLRISDICSELQISPSQLTRYFLMDTGRTPHQFILDRRAELAHRLLTRTTSQVKLVAAACGMPNIQQFNRFVKDRYGQSPRVLRQNRGIVDIYRAGDLEKARGRKGP